MSEEAGIARFEPRPATGTGLTKQADGTVAATPAADTAEPLGCVELDDLLAQHAEAWIELRIVPSIWPLWDRVVASTLEFSGSRLRNAAPRTTE